MYELIDKTNKMTCSGRHPHVDSIMSPKMDNEQGSKIALVRLYLRVPQAAGRVKNLIFLVKIKFSPYMPTIFVMQGKCLFSDISRPDECTAKTLILLAICPT